MTRSLPPLTWIRAFESAARHLSFTAAAAELGLTQSAVSQHVRALERRLGVPFFLRKPRGLALTDAGRRLVPEVSAGLGKLTDAVAIFESGVPDGLLTVATSVSFAQWFLAPGLGRFLADNPELRVRIVSTIWPDHFATSTADIEIRFGSRDLVGEGAEQLLPDRLIVVASPNLLPSLADRPLDWVSLRQYPLIQAVGTSDDWKRWAEHVLLGEEPEPSLFVDSHGLAVDIARSGAGVALTSSLLAMPCLAEETLKVAHQASAPAEDGYFLAIDPDGNNDAVDSFVRWLKSEIRQVTERFETGPQKPGGLGRAD